MRSFYTEYLDTYGPCHIPYNIHLMLHVRQDCINWSSLRSHSAFKFERLNHELMVAPRTNSESKVTKSIVRAVCELGIRMQIVRDEPGCSKPCAWPPTLPTISNIPCLMNCLEANISFYSKTRDQFSTDWDIGNYISVIDHSTGDSIFITGAPITKIVVFIRTSTAISALIHPVRLSNVPSRIKGAYQLIEDDTPEDPNLFKLVCLSEINESIHISPVCTYSTDENDILLIPVCGPLPY